MPTSRELFDALQIVHPKLTRDSHGIQPPKPERLESRPRTEVSKWSYGSGWRAAIFDARTDRKLGACTHRHRTRVSAGNCADRMASDRAPHAERRKQPETLSVDAARVRTAFGAGTRAAADTRREVNGVLREHQTHSVELVKDLKADSGEVFGFWCRTCEYGAVLSWAWTDVKVTKTAKKSAKVVR